MSQKNNNIKAVKSGIWYTISNFLVKGIVFLTTPIFTRLLTQSEFGIFNNYLSWLSIATIFVTLNLESTLISARFDFKDDFDSYILSMLSLSCLSTAIWLVIVNIGNKYFESFLDLDIIYINIMLLYLLFLPAVNMFQTRERYFYEYKKTALTAVILAVGSSLLSVFLVMYLPNALFGRIIGSVVPAVILGIVFYFYFFKKGKRIKLKYWKYAIPICLPYIPHLLSMTLLNSTDRVMITKICGSEQTALYSLAYTCGTMITLLLTSLNSAYSPWLGEKISKNDFKSIKKFSYIYILIFFFLSVGIMLLSPEALYILGGKPYMQAIYVLAPVSMGCVCQFLYTMFVNVEQYKKKTGGMAIGSAVAAVANFVLNLIFIPRFGYLAAAYTTLAGYIILLLIHMLLVKIIGLKDIYDYKFIGIIVITGIVIMMLITFLYSYNFLRYLVICIYFCVLLYFCIRNRDRLTALLKIRS